MWDSVSAPNFKKEVQLSEVFLMGFPAGMNTKILPNWGSMA